LSFAVGLMMATLLYCLRSNANTASKRLYKCKLHKNTLKHIMKLLNTYYEGLTLTFLLTSHCG